ncbi:MAG: PIN domain-containing protein [Candidatus Methanomethylicia archaeon]
MEALIDTNVLVYDTIEDSVFHEEAKKTLDKLDRWLIPSVVIEEFVLVLNQLNLKREIIGKKIDEILKSKRIEIVSIERSDLSSACISVLSEKLSFKKFNDKIILSIAKRRKTHLFTFDSELKKEGKRYGVELI